MGPESDALHSLLGKIQETIIAAIPADGSILVLLDQSGRIIHESRRPESGGELQLAFSRLNAEIMKKGRPLFLPAREAGEPGGGGGGGDGNGSGPSLLCLPLSLTGGPAGAIGLVRENGRPPFSSRDLEMLLVFSGSISAVLQRHFTPEVWKEDSGRQPDTRIIGRSKAMIGIQSLIHKIKDHDAPVFIAGESGTGKELVARAVHEHGARQKGPFVAVNCGAIPDHLLESELFGHARGAFTGACRDKAGLIEEAHGGTFFLDEIGDLSPPLQAKLLRLIQEREIRRVGENRTRRVDVRFMSATNKDLEAEIKRGGFREDLFYRLRIVVIEIPPLRNRREDILPLLQHFVGKYSREMNRPRAFFTPRALELLHQYTWPGNVREVQNEIQRCLILAGGDSLIREDHLSAKINPERESSLAFSYNFFQAKAEFEKRFLNQALARFGYNRARTAGELGLSRQGLFKLMKKHSIETQKAKAGAVSDSGPGTVKTVNPADAAADS